MKWTAPLPSGRSLSRPCIRWSRLDGDVLHSPEFRGLSSGARDVYNQLGFFIDMETRSWQITVQEIATAVGKSHKHTRRLLGELDEAGLIARRPSYLLENGKARRVGNLITLTAPPSIARTYEEDRQPSLFNKLDGQKGHDKPAFRPQPASTPNNELTEPEGPMDSPAEPEPTVDACVDGEAATSDGSPSSAVQTAPPPPSRFPAEEISVGDEDEPHQQAREGGGSILRGGGDQSSGGLNSPPAQLSEQQIPLNPPQPEVPDPPNPPRLAPQGEADEGQVEFILQALGPTADASWWALAAEGHPGLVAFTRQRLDAARRWKGCHVSRRARSLPASLREAARRHAEQALGEPPPDREPPSDASSDGLSARQAPDGDEPPFDSGPQAEQGIPIRTTEPTDERLSARRATLLSRLSAFKHYLVEHVPPPDPNLSVLQIRSQPPAERRRLLLGRRRDALVEEAEALLEALRSPSASRASLTRARAFLDRNALAVEDPDGRPALGQRSPGDLDEP